MITPAALAHVPLFASAHDGALGPIVARSADIHVNQGEWVVLEGEAAAFFVVLEGLCEIVKMTAGSEQIVERVEPGGFFGETSLLLGSVFLAGLRAVETSRLMRLEALDFHEVLAHCPDANRQILATMTRHVSGLQQAAIVTPMLSVTVLGRRNDPACYDLRDFLSRNQIGLRWIDPSNAGTFESANVPPELLENGVYPSVVFSDRSFMSAPKYPELAERLGLQIAPRATTYDVAIVGAGPAGLAAAVYGASEGLSTVLVEAARRVAKLDRRRASKTILAFRRVFQATISRLERSIKPSDLVLRSSSRDKQPVSCRGTERLKRTKSSWIVGVGCTPRQSSSRRAWRGVPSTFPVRKHC